MTSWLHASMVRPRQVRRHHRNLVTIQPPIAARRTRLRGCLTSGSTTVRRWSYDDAPVAVTRAFAPILAANGGGALVNVLSVLSWLSFPGSGGYSSAKAAMWAATNSLRQTLLGQGTLVTAVHVAHIDTDMSASVTAPKISPEIVAAQTLDAVEAGEAEVLADDVTRQVRAALSGPLHQLYPSVASTASSPR